FLNRAMKVSLPGSDQLDGITESIARVHMAQGQFEESAKLLERIGIPDVDMPLRGGYIRRHSLLTKGEVLTSLGRFDESFQYFDEAISLARRTGDGILEDAARLIANEARALSQDPHFQQASETEVAPPRAGTPESSILYE